jgi:hypothetical protein
MKKILAFIVCIVLVCAMPLVVFAEETTEDVVDTTPVVEETIPETDVPDVAPTPSTDLTPEEEAKGYADIIAAWFEANSGALGIVFTIIGYGIVLFKKVKTMTASVTTMNNNAVSISENGSIIANNALTQVKDIAEVVRGYSDKMAELLAKIEKSEEDKQKLETALTDVHTHLKTAKLANVELANEVAELLVLANIPNSKKDELYARHLAAVGAIAEAENTEVTEDDREEA